MDVSDFGHRSLNDFDLFSESLYVVRAGSCRELVARSDAYGMSGVDRSICTEGPISLGETPYQLSTSQVRSSQGVEDDLRSGDGVDSSSDSLIVGVAISSGCDLYDCRCSIKDAQFKFTFASV